MHRDAGVWPGAGADDRPDLRVWPFPAGGFARVLSAWQAEAPHKPPAAQAQRALDAVSGVDLNPFVVEIARFRLLLHHYLTEDTAALDTVLVGSIMRSSATHPTSPL
jgi:hypothetical protein